MPNTIDAILMCNPYLGRRPVDTGDRQKPFLTEQANELTRSTADVDDPDAAIRRSIFSSKDEPERR